MRSAIFEYAQTERNLSGSKRPSAGRQRDRMIISALRDRLSVLGPWVADLVRYGIPGYVSNGDQEIVMLLDGVGGFQFLPVLVRRVLREGELPMSSTWFRWQMPVPGLMLVDLMWRSRNQRRAALLARQLQDLHARFPSAKIHVIGYSGGTGVAVFALEALGGRVPIETLLLFAPAISPNYNLAPMMQNVRRAYVMVSPRDSWLLGIGTRLFGTMDRRRVASAGLVGFSVPEDIGPDHREAYSRIHVVEWCEEFRDSGHSGGHIGWTQLSFLRKHLVPLLAGQPLISSRPLDSNGFVANN